MKNLDTSEKIIAKVLELRASDPFDFSKERRAEFEHLCDSARALKTGFLGRVFTAFTGDSNEHIFVIAQKGNKYQISAASQYNEAIAYENDQWISEKKLAAELEYASYWSKLSRL